MCSAEQTLQPTLPPKGGRLFVFPPPLGGRAGVGDRRREADRVIIWVRAPKGRGGNPATPANTGDSRAKREGLTLTPGPHPIYSMVIVSRST